MRITFIPKPGKEAYIAPKAYRLITLQSFFLKTLERLVPRYREKTDLAKNPIQSTCIQKKQIDGDWNIEELEIRKRCHWDI